MENKVFLASSLTFHYICRDKVTDMRFIDVVLPLPLSSLFTYALPAELQDTVRTGCRVVVAGRFVRCGSRGCPLLGQLWQPVALWKSSTACFVDVCACCNNSLSLWELAR